jgi:transketolase
MHARRAPREADWQQRFDRYRSAHPQLAQEFERRVIRRALPQHWHETRAQLLSATAEKGATLASRKASQQMIEALRPVLPELLGGSADLTGSNLTAGKDAVAVRRGAWGNHINYGVREFAMSALMNGLALHGGFIPYGGTFLTFSDYSRNAVRMSALMRQQVIYVFTHDSIHLGEDGPTHQPVEHASSLRLIPHNSVWRPADAVETGAAWLAAIERRDGPTCLLLSRQNLPHLERSAGQLGDIARGGYVLADDPAARLTLLATGSEVALALEARTQLAAQGIAARVVSMPNCGEFDRQSAQYRATVLPRALPVLAIEAGVSNFWRAYTGFEGDVIGIDRFGESAPAEQVAEELGFTAEAVAARARALIEDGPRS